MLKTAAVQWTCERVEAYRRQGLKGLGSSVQAWSAVEPLLFREPGREFRVEGVQHTRAHNHAVRPPPGGRCTAPPDEHHPAIVEPL